MIDCRPSLARVAALNTVRSAPVSTRKGTFIQASLPALMSPAMMGLSTPSSNSAHSPSMRIDTCDFLLWNVMHEAAIIIRMCHHGLCHSLFRRIRNEQLFASDADAFATIARKDLYRMRLKPGEVPLISLILCPCFG